jgi:hypothetical protein
MDKRQFPAQYQLYDFFEFIVGLISLIAAFVTCYDVIVKQDYTFALIITIAIGITIVIALKTYKLREINTKRLEVFSRTWHITTDITRDASYFILDQKEKGVLRKELLWESLKANTQKIVDALADILSTSSGYTVCVCLKYFVTDTDGVNPKYDKKPEDYQLKVLCRSQNTDRRRITEELSQVGLNTDFLQIMKDDKSYFWSRDLTKTDQKLRELEQGCYSNSTPIWSQFYNSTIVVPIRIKRSIYPYDPSNERYLLLGFLCADSLSTSAFPNQHASYYVDIIKGVADALFPYLDRVFHYLGEIK